MFVCMSPCMHLCVHPCFCAWVQPCVCACVCECACVCVCVCVCACTCVCECVPACMNVCMRACVNVCVSGCGGAYYYVFSWKVGSGQMTYNRINLFYSGGRVHILHHQRKIAHISNNFGLICFFLTFPGLVSQSIKKIEHWTIRVIITA